MTTTYSQCALSNRRPDGTLETQVSWLPSQYAVVGASLRLRERGGAWDLGWVVTVAGDEHIPETDLPEPRKDFRTHRRGTGDDEPKVRSR